MKHPFVLPRRLPQDIVRVRNSWKGLLRGEAVIPFGDDLRMTDLAGMSGRLFLIDVFERPERYRFNTVGHDITEAGLEGVFLDEHRLGWPFAFLRAQCSVTVESGRPTLHHGPGDPRLKDPRDFARLLLPLWGEGHIALLLGVIADA